MISDCLGTTRCIAPGWTGPLECARHDAESGRGGLMCLSSWPMSRKAGNSKVESAWRFDINALNLGAGKAYGKCRIMNFQNARGSATRFIERDRTSIKPCPN